MGSAFVTGTRRIALFSPAWPGQETPNGIATAVYNLATGLAAAGHHPVIITPVVDGPGPPEIPVVTVPDLPWPLWDRLRGKFGSGPDREAVERHWLRRLAGAVDVALQEHGADVLIVEETNGWAAHLCRQVPVIVFLHGPWCLHRQVASLGSAEDAAREMREDAGFKAAAGLMAPSRNVLTAVEDKVDVSHSPRIVLPNALWSDAATPSAAAQPERNILFVGRVDHHKGADTVFRAFARLGEIEPDVRLTFVGPENPRVWGLSTESLMADIPKQISARIDYKGRLDRQAVAGLRKTHAIALIASRYEVFGYTLLEAMAAGQAIVSTAVGGPAEMLRDEGTALLVPPDDPDAMASALGRLVADGDLARQLGVAAQDRVVQDFNPIAIAEQTVAFVDTVVPCRTG